MAIIKQRWGTKIGVIFAVAGSAVGLGNFLRFPGLAAQNGGGAFMIPYLVALVLVGLPLVWVEWMAGRFGGGKGHTTAPGIFQSLWEKAGFVKYLGAIGIFGPFLIYMYYVYIESWCLAYAWYSITGTLSQISTNSGFIAFLNDYRGLTDAGTFAGTTPAIIFFLITFVLNISVTYYGIRGGIERVCNLAIPLLMIFAAVIAVRVITLFAPDPLNPDWNSINGLGFLWNPDFSALKDAKVWLKAAGQIFYTLSVGIGVIITYASYVKKKDDIAASGLAAASTNEFAEVILASTIVIPAAVMFFGPTNTEAIADAGLFDLGFVTMPQIFNSMPAGALFGFLWFFMLFLAGITSSISVAQPSVAFMENSLGWSRKKAVKIFAIAAFILCQPAIWFFHRGVFGDIDFWGAAFFIVLGATVEVILVAWIFGINKAWKELHRGAKIRVPGFFKYVIKFVTPLFLLGVLGYWFYTEWLDVITMKDVDPANVPYILGIRLVMLAILITLFIMVNVAWRKRKNNNNMTGE